MMSSRERVEAALGHREGDRVPLDLGATDATGIHVSSLYALRQGLGLHEPGTPPRVLCSFPVNGKPVPTFEGTPVLVPGEFPTEPEPNGELLMYPKGDRSEEHTSELQSLRHLVCRLLLEKK